VLVENALFATLDPTTRRGEFADGRPFVLTDTVGFVRHLPTQLVEAFRSTLEEVIDADLLVHVVDGSDVNPLGQINAVRQVLNEVITGAAKAATSSPVHDAHRIPELLVINKVDAAGGLALAQLRRALPDAVFVSARIGDGLERLQQRMAELIAPTDATVDVTIPYDRGDLVNRVHADGRVDATEHTADGTRIKARVPISLASSLREFGTF
jgi:GTP-binding protein HflX